MQAKGAKPAAKPVVAVADVADAEEETATALSSENYVTILDEDAAHLDRELKKAPLFAFDTETDSLDNISANMVGLISPLSLALRPMYRLRMIIWMHRIRSRATACLSC
jgi:hypothetical protein